MAAPAGAKAPASPGRGTLTGGLAEGNGLPYRQKSLFESSTGADLSGVRVRTDDAAASQADAHGARAFAVGQDISFAKGEYQPDTPEGDQLLAHEVAHTVQQRGATPGPGGAVAKTTPGDGAESNADTAASAMVQGAPAQVTSEPLAIARKAQGEPVVPAGVPDAPQAGGPQPGQPGVDPKAEAKTDGPIGELSAERVGMVEEEGDEPVGPPQNLDQGKADLASKGEGLPKEGGAEELKGLKVEGGGGGGAAAPGGGGGDVQMTDELQLSISAAQADAKEGAAEASAEANAYKAEMGARRDRFENEQNALTLEQLKAMSPADKRSTLIEMGYDKKAVKKMKDAQLEGIIAGRVETEQRKSKILGMEPDELKALSPSAKMQFLQDLGIDKKDLDKIGPQKAAQAFDDVMRVAHVPGQYKVKVKVKGGLLGKSWELNIKVDAEGSPEIEAKKKGGFLSKLWGWVKMALPIIAVVLAPLTAGASLIALSVYQTVTAIANGDWLGAIIGGAGALVGLGGIAALSKTASGAANAFGKIAQVAEKVQKVAEGAKAAMAAAQAKSPGGLLAALSKGAATFATFASASASKFSATMKNWSARLDKWSKVISGGEKVVAGIKSGDPAGAIAGAFDAASAAVSKPDGNKNETSAKAKDFQKYSRIASYASAGQRAAKGQPPDYGGIVDAAMGIAGELKVVNKTGSAAKITAAASRLTRAIQTKNPGELAAAALGLAEAIQTSKVGDDDDGPGGKGTPEEERAKITERYAKATSVVKFANAAVAAASAKPRPNYIAALDASTQLIADLTDSKKADQAAVLTSAFDTWTSAVRSKDEKAILAAGEAFGRAINSVRAEITAERDDAKKAAQAKLPPGENLGDDGGNVATYNETGVATGEDKATPDGAGPAAPTATVTTSEEVTGFALGPRDATPGANYSVVPGDTLSGIASRFKTSVATLRSRNPQLAGDTVYLGQRIFVPGADVLLTPNVTTSTDFKGPAGPGGGANPPLTTDVNVDVTGKTISPAAKGVIKVTRALGKLAGWPEEFQDFVKTISKTVDLYEECLARQDTTSQQYKTAVAALEAAATANEWGDAIIKRLAGYRQDFDQLLELDSSNQAIQAFALFGQSLKAVSTVVSLPSGLMEAIDDLKKLRTGDPLERANALSSLLKTAKDLPEDLQFVYRFATRMAPGTVASIEAALGTVRTALTKFGPKAQNELMARVFTPVLEQVARTKGGAVAMKLAQSLASEMGRFAATQLAKATSAVALRTAAGALVGVLGGVTAAVLSAPAQFAIAYYTFLNDLLPDIFFGARDGSSLMLTPYLYGKMIHVLKSEVWSQPTNSPDECRATINYLYNVMLKDSPKAEVKNGWPPYAVSRLGDRWYARYATAAATLLSNTGTADRVDAARRLQSAAIDYINKVFKDEFKFDPPA